MYGREQIKDVKLSFPLYDTHLQIGYILTYYNNPMHLSIGEDWYFSVHRRFYSLQKY